MLKAPRSAYLEYLDWLATAEPEPRVIASRQVAGRMIAEMQQVGSEPIDTGASATTSTATGTTAMHLSAGPAPESFAPALSPCLFGSPPCIWSCTSRRGLTGWRNERERNPIFSRNGARHSAKAAKHKRAGLLSRRLHDQYHDGAEYVCSQAVACNEKQARMTLRLACAPTASSRRPDGSPGGLLGMGQVGSKWSDGSRAQEVQVCAGWHKPSLSREPAKANSEARWRVRVGVSPCAIYA